MKTGFNSLNALPTKCVLQTDGSTTDRWIKPMALLTQSSRAKKNSYKLHLFSVAPFS